MSKKDWSGLSSLFGKTGNVQTKNIQKEPIYFDTNYNTFEKSYFGGYEVEAEEPTIPDEEYEKEMKIVELCEQVLTEPTDEDVSNNVEDENVNEEFLLDDEPSAEELEEFKRLNGIDDIKEDAVKEDEVKEQPTETRVTSIKVSKPKVEKTQKPVEKEVKQKTGKKEQSTKPRAPKKK